MARFRLRWAFVTVAVLAGAADPSFARNPRDPRSPLDETDGAGIDLMEALADVPWTDGSPPADLRALRGRLAQIVETKGRGAGAAVVVIGPQGALVDGFGRASPEAAMEASTLFRVGSLTKSFISLAVMRLVEQGKLRLEDRVQALAPEIAVANAWERTHPLQVAHLLEHTAGFDEMRFSEILERSTTEDRPLRGVLAVNPRSRVTRWPPGTRHSYSQPGYTTAAYLIEKASGMPYERYLEEEVFRPLGIEGASLRLTDAARARLAAGHHDGRREPYLRLLHRPAMNLMISAQGLSRLLQMLLGRGLIDGRRFLSEASIARIERSGTLPYGPPTVRYGLGNWGDVSTRIPMRGHGGFMPGYQTVYRYSPDRRFGYAVMLNDTAGRGLGALSHTILEYLLAGQNPPPPPLVPQPPEVLAGHAGHYRLASPNIEFQRVHTDVYRGIQLAARGDRLWLTLPERSALPLVPTGPDTFRFWGQSESSIVFTRTAQGRRAVIIGQQYYEEESGWWAWARKAALELALMLLTSTIFVPVIIAARGQREEAFLLLRPLVAALLLFAMSQAFGHARHHGELGFRTWSTIAFWLLGWAFGLCSYSAFGRAARAARADAHLAVRLYAVLVSGAAVWVTLHLSRYGLLGLRTWRW